MEAEGESNEQDDKDNGNLEEGEDDIFEDDYVDPNLVEKSHVQEQVDPGHSDGDCSDLPLEAGWFPEEIVERQEEGEAVDEEIKEEYEWQVKLSPLDSLHLIPKKGELSVPKEENNSCNIQQQHDDTKDLVRELHLCFRLVFNIGCVSCFILLNDSEELSAVELFWRINGRSTSKDKRIEGSKEDHVDSYQETVGLQAIHVPFPFRDD